MIKEGCSKKGGVAKPKATEITGLDLVIVYFKSIWEGAAPSPLFQRICYRRRGSRFTTMQPQKFARVLKFRI